MSRTPPRGYSTLMVTLPGPALKPAVVLVFWPDTYEPTPPPLAAELATARRWACLDRGDSLAFETVFSAPDKLEFVREARRRGYF